MLLALTVQELEDLPMPPFNVPAANPHSSRTLTCPHHPASTHFQSRLDQELFPLPSSYFQQKSFFAFKLTNSRLHNIVHAALSEY